MAITIRRAESRDLDKTLKLLSEVLELHAKIRPDIFISGTTKYTREELQAIFDNDQTPVFVASGDSGEVVGYAFCVMKRQPFSTNMKDFSTLFIDDLCVDENCRGQHVGTLLFDHVKQYAKEQGCYFNIIVSFLDRFGILWSKQILAIMPKILSAFCAC